MRLFIAIEFPKEIKDYIEESTKLLKASCKSGNFSLKENYHLTLVFIGEVPSSRVKDITAVVDDCECKPFDLQIGEFSRFKCNDGDILFRKLNTPNELLRLQSSLHEELLEKGFTLQERNFCPHITLARRATLLNEIRLSELSKDIMPLFCAVSNISLMLSQCIGGKLTYTTLYRKELS